ncbi:acyltransferase family protein [Brevundimonas subvibrioides]|uniref:acyltransferase family protein n=1 Tax=Brevundimonas subvibrioides TaxID=74313 RepID=UPI003CCB528D
MVVVTHSTFYASERLTPGSYVWGRGTMGVDIFFVISGFVMYASSIHLERASGGWREFATKRLIRIVPLYWLVTSMKLAILLVIPSVVLHLRSTGLTSSSPTSSSPPTM